MTQMMEVEKLLKKSGISYRLIKLSRKVVSFNDVKKHVPGLDPEDGCKTIVAEGDSGDIFAFFLLGEDRLDFKKASKIAGENLKMLGVAELKAKTGMEPGTVCPLLLKDAKVYVDKKVLDREKVHFGSGEELFGLVMATKDLAAAYPARDFS